MARRALLLSGVPSAAIGASSNAPHHPNRPPRRSHLSAGAYAGDGVDTVIHVGLDWFAGFVFAWGVGWLTGAALGVKQENWQRSWLLLVLFCLLWMFWRG